MNSPDRGGWMGDGAPDAEHAAPRGFDPGRVSEPITTLSSRQMGRSLGALYTAGALVAVAWVILPHVDRSGDRAVLAMAALALLFGLAMVAGAVDDWPATRFHVAIALIQVLITVSYVAGGDPANDIRLFYLWATPYAVFFFSSRAAALHTAWVAICMTAALVILHPPLGFGASIWLMTLGTVAAVWSVVAWATRGMRDGELRLRYAATHDALTGLPNRVLFLARCTEALERVRTNGGRVIVLLVDLDRFKVVNDTFGHHAGDALLSVVAPRMHNAVRSSDTVARLGGDEFAIVIEDARGTIDPEVVAGHLADALSEPVRTDQLVLYTSGGIGHAVSSSAADTALSLLRDADAAMYRAKAQGPGRTAAFDGGMRVEARDRAIMEGHLRTASERGEIDLAYQPAIDLETGRIVGAEALLRWTNHELGPIGPAEFVPLAEETGLIVEIGAWVLDEAARTLRGWMDAGAVDGRFTMAVNVSAVQLGDGLVELAQRV
ncbi:MAG: putative bifunctional diguanylate cyclase/phosphodiesterase, partial [Acidimicrobiales bacterium]